MIDAHVHFWDPARRDDILIVRREPSLEKRAMPAELSPLLAAAGIESAVAIQSAPNLSETLHLIETSSTMDAVRAVVGWVDLAAPDCAAQIANLARRPKIVGVRAMLNRVDGPDWLATTAVRSGLAALEKSGLSLDLITRTEHISAIRAVAADFPGLTMIVDHGASPPTGQPGFDAWKKATADLAESTRVFTKLSGLAEETTGEWSAETLEPTLRHLLANFGAARMMWASNWPVIDLRGGYLRWVSESRKLLDRAGLTPIQRNAIEDTTARRAYRISN